MKPVGLHPDRKLETARGAFIACGYNEQERRAEIDALERKEWKGKMVFKVRCNGQRGKGPHDVYLAEHWLWGLISLRHFICPYHFGDDPQGLEAKL